VQELKCATLEQCTQRCCCTSAACEPTPLQGSLQLVVTRFRLLRGVADRILVGHDQPVQRRAAPTIMRGLRAVARALAARLKDGAPLTHTTSMDSKEGSGKKRVLKFLFLEKKVTRQRETSIRVRRERRTVNGGGRTKYFKRYT
jgi:hypothetical protein